MTPNKRRVALIGPNHVVWQSSWCTCDTASYQNNTHSFLRDQRCETLAQREHKWSTVSHRAWLGTATARVAVGWGAHLPCQRRDRCSAHSQRAALQPEPAAKLSALHARDPAHSMRQHRSAAGGVRSAASRRARSRTAACLCSIAVCRVGSPFTRHLQSLKSPTTPDVTSCSSFSASRL